MQPLVRKELSPWALASFILQDFPSGRQLGTTAKSVNLLVFNAVFTDHHYTPSLKSAHEGWMCGRRCFSVPFTLCSQAKEIFLLLCLFSPWRQKAVLLFEALAHSKGSNQFYSGSIWAFLGPQNKTRDFRVEPPKQQYARGSLGTFLLIGKDSVHLYL